MFVKPTVDKCSTWWDMKFECTVCLLLQIFHVEGDQWIYNRPLNKRVAEIKDS